MKILAFVTVLAAFVIWGCTALTGGPHVDVEIINRSSHDLKNARAVFGDYECEWGIVGKTFTKGFGFFPHPITPSTELHWDEESGHRVEKIDLRQIYHHGQAGRLTFTVRDGGAEVVFRKE